MDSANNLVRETVNRLSRRQWYIGGNSEPRTDFLRCVEPDLPGVQVHKDRVKPAKGLEERSTHEEGGLRDESSIHDDNSPTGF